MKAYHILAVVGLALLTACATAVHRSTPVDIRHQIANVYGAERFNQVEAIQYTFNAAVGDKGVRRSWTWWPGEDKVRYTPADGETVTYRRTEITSSGKQNLKDIDAKFINDQYWLLFPLHLIWDEGLRVTDGGMQPLPIGEGEARWIEVVYPLEGGYTPGDAYDLFVDEQNRLVQWVYRKGGSDTATRQSTWEDHRRFGPLTLSLDHNYAEGNFRVWFTEVGVKVENRRYWFR